MKVQPHAGRNALRKDGSGENNRENSIRGKGRVMSEVWLKYEGREPSGNAVRYVRGHSRRMG